MKAAFLPVSVCQLTSFNEIYCYLCISLTCFWRAFWQWYICIMHHRYTYFTTEISWQYPLRRAGKYSGPISPVKPVSSCQVCLTTEKRGKMHCGWHRYADRLFASFTSTGNVPKEVKEVHWRSKINLWTMQLASQRTHSSLWSGVVVWLCGPRNPNYHTKKGTD